MDTFTCFRAKNAMIFSNLVSNGIGVAVIMVISSQTSEYIAANLIDLAHRINVFFLPLAFVIPLIVTLAYEKPIRNYLNSLRDHTPVSEEAALRARRKLLNEPFFLIGLDSAVWLISAVLFSGIFWFFGAEAHAVKEAFFQSFFTGLITVTVAYFVFEFVMQRRVIPYFFPEGGLSMIPGTFRIRIRTRLTALLLAINIVPLVALLDESTKIISLSEHSPQSLAQLQTSIYFQVVLFVGVGVWVVFLVGSNLTRSLEEIIHVLGKIKAGRFDNRVRVASNDEIGYTGDVINEMTRGLAERDRIRHSLILAKEVQQNLFPPADRAFKGIHIAGKSIYCDETGGDYYDYFFIGSREERKFGVAVGDVSGHGISSALLMATVRSALRQRVSQPGDTARIITDVNAQLAEDVDISGDFVTLFFLVLDKDANRFEWVRAGHEPAVVYDPEKDAFDKLDGAGIALGLNARWVYESYARSGMAKGQVILLGTDGVWEAQNAAGQRIGKDPIYEVIRSHHTRSARDILDTVFQTIAAFQNGAKNEDDITAVIIKYGYP